MLVNVDINQVPEHLQNAYDTVLPVSLLDNYNGIPCALHLPLTCHKRQLYYIHNNPPPGRVRVFLCSHRRKIDLQVLHPHPLQAAVQICMNAPHRPFNFLLSQDPVCHANRIYHYMYGVISFIIIDIIPFIIGIIICLKEIYMSLCIIKLEYIISLKCDQDFSFTIFILVILIYVYTQTYYQAPQ